MKLNNNFVLRQIADQWIVLPLGEKTVDFSAMLTLNETGAMLWQKLEQGAEKSDLVAALLDEYDVTAEIAQADVEEFLQKLENAGCIE